ncbi:MAG: hypothetical protein AB7L09_12990 [Nitrospira sp.]
MLTLFTAPFKAWKRRRVEKLTAKAAHLEEGQEYDLLFLYEQGFVRARGTGQSITTITGEIENLIAKTLRVVIKPGTYFVSAGNTQNMVTRREYTVTLYPESKKEVSIDATCINADRPIPGKSDQFYGVKRVSENLARFLEASRGRDPMVVQAGVWTLTDGYSGEDVKNHLYVQDREGNRHQAVSDWHINEAKRILHELAIPNRL